MALSRKYNDFAAETLVLGNQLRSCAKRSIHTTAPHATPIIANWYAQAHRFQEVMQTFIPDDPATTTKFRDAWALAKALYHRHYPPNRVSPLTATIPTSQSALDQARYNLEILDQQAHESSLLHLITTRSPLTTSVDTDTEFTSAYESALKTAHWKQHAKRRRVTQLIEDLQAPLHEQAVRNFRRLSHRINDVIQELRGRRRGRTQRQFRDELQDILADLGFGRTLSDSLPRFQKWARDEFRTLGMLASRRYLPGLKRQLACTTHLPTLVTRTYRATERYLSTLHEVYLEAVHSLSFLTEVHLEIAATTEELKAAASADTPNSPSIELVRGNFDFRHRYPIACDWTNRVPYLSHSIDTTPSPFHVAADHKVLMYQLRNLQRNIHDASMAILSRTNRRTNRRITNVAALEERELPHILDALRRTELLLADYTAKYGSEARIALTQHLFNGGYTAAHHVLTHGHANSDAFLIALFGSADLGKRQPKAHLIT